MEGKVQASHERNWTRAVVRRKRFGMSLGQRGDFARLAQSATPGKVEHDDIERVRGQDVAKAFHACEVFAAAIGARVCRRRSATALKLSIFLMGSSTHSTLNSASASQFSRPLVNSRDYAVRT